MLFTNTQSFANSNDPDIAYLHDGNFLHIDTLFVVINHNSLDMNIFPLLYVDNNIVVLSEINSGGDYESNRVSFTQTVIKIKNRGLKLLSTDIIVDQIGDAEVGVTLVVQ